MNNHSQTSNGMKRAHFFVLLGIIFLIPVVSFAWIPGQPLVPQEVIDFVQSENPQPSKVQACHLVDLVKNLLDFGVFLSAFIATIMFVYAGILYVTAASNAENLTKAKGIFGKVVLGFVIVLTAWLIVSMLLHAFTDQDLRAWTNIACIEYTSVPSVDIETVGTGKVGSEKLEAENRALLALEDVGVNKPACMAGQTTDCTNTAGLKAQTIGYVAGVKDQCDAAIGAACDITITGGTEGGHSGGTNPGSHGGGDKVDLRVTPNLNTYVEKQVKAGNFSVIKEPQFGVRQYFDEKTGAVWTYESEIKNGVEVVHYDVCVSNCAAPAARGS